MSVMAEKLPSIMIERPKMPRATWDALRAHIIRERQRKKLELERNAEVRKRKNFAHFHSKFANFEFSVWKAKKVGAGAQEKARSFNFRRV